MLMKILMMHRNDCQSGGAQIQMNRLREGLRKTGVDARILCREGHARDAVIMPSRPLAERVLGAAARRIGLNDIHLISSSLVTRMPEFAAADLLDIHCLHSGTFSYLSLPSLCSEKPVVFTFHDMWPITGHCHASLECDRWMSGCGACPHLDVEPRVRRDATALEWRLKRSAYRRSSFTIVTPSRWLKELVGRSMLSSAKVHHIPHGVDAQVFAPLDKSACRAALGLPRDGVILLCAIEYMSRPLKGASLMVDALHRLSHDERRNVTLVVFGRSDRSLIDRIPVPVIDLGYLEHDRVKALAYSAADVLINPSRAESFGLVALEGMACGLPVVAFDVGGISELVRPGITGFLAIPESVESLAAEIRRMLACQNSARAMGKRARTLVEAQFTIEKQVERTLALYADVVSSRRQPRPLCEEGPTAAV